MDKTIKELKNLYPDITWELVETPDEILENYGNGIILRGEKQGEMKEFFILEEDKRKLQWGHVIANYLNKTVEEVV